MALCSKLNEKSKTKDVIQNSLNISDYRRETLYEIAPNMISEEQKTVKIWGLDYGYRKDEFPDFSDEDI